MFDNRQDISRRFPLRTSCGQVQYTRAPPDPLWADRPLSPGSPKDGKTPTESRYSPSKSPDSVVPTLRSCAFGVHDWLDPDRHVLSGRSSSAKSSASTLLWTPPASPVKSPCPSPREPPSPKLDSDVTCQTLQADDAQCKDDSIPCHLRTSLEHSNDLLPAGCQPLLNQEGASDDGQSADEKEPLPHDAVPAQFDRSASHSLCCSHTSISHQPEDEVVASTEDPKLPNCLENAEMDHDLYHPCLARLDGQTSIESPVVQRRSHFAQSIELCEVCISEASGNMNENPKVKPSYLSWSTVDIYCNHRLLQVLLLSAAFAAFIVVVSLQPWPPVVVGHWNRDIQVERAQPKSVVRFELSVKHIQDFNAKAGWNNMSQADPCIWRQVVIVYQYRDRPVIDASGLNAVRAIEKSLKSLPGWNRLCAIVPQIHRHRCLPGDTIVTVAFGSARAPSSNLKMQGVLSEVVLDGSGDAVGLPVGELLKLLREPTTSSRLLRWTPESTQNERTALRSSFSFCLPLSLASSWSKFASEELRPALHDFVQRGEDGSGPRLFFTVDDIEANNFHGAIDPSLFLTITSMAAAFTVGLMTRKLVLAASVLVLVAMLPVSIAKMANTSTMPAIALVSWPLVASGCAELAVACSAAVTLMWSRSIFETAGPAEPLLAWVVNLPVTSQLLTRLRMVLLLILRLLIQMPAPTIASAGVWYMAGSALSELPLLMEFCLYTSQGLFLVAVWGTLTFPPAILLGEALHRGQKSTDARKTHPTYFEQKSNWSSQILEQLIGSLTSLANTYTFRMLAIASAVAAVSGFSAMTSSPGRAFGAIPQLLEKEHRAGAGILAAGLFSTLPSPTKSLEALPKYARECAPMAADEADCSWYTCEVNGSLGKLPKKLCKCWSSGSPNSSHCNASVRMWGALLHERVSLNGTLWPWLLQQTNCTWPGDNDVAATLRQRENIKMHDWQSGLTLSQPQVSGTLPSGRFTPPPFEDVEIRALCFCDTFQCQVPSSWRPLPGTFQLPERPGSQSDDPNAKSGVFNTTSFQVFAIWGLLEDSHGFRAHNLDNRDFDLDFKIEDPWFQRRMLSFCEGTAPGLQITSRQCWIMQFRAWVLAQGLRYPLRASEFFDRLDGFLRDTKDCDSNSLTSHMRQPKCFWLTQSGRVGGTFAAFTVNRPSKLEEFSALRTMWQEYTVLRNKGSPPAVGKVWLASHAWAEQDEDQVVQRGVIAVYCLCPLYCSILTLLCTCSFRLTIATTCCLVIATVAGSAITLAPRKGNSVNSIDLVSILGFIMCTFPPLLRMAQQYTTSPCGPGNQPLNYNHDKKDEEDEEDEPEAEVGPRSQDFIVRSFSGNLSVNASLDLGPKYSEPIDEFWIGALSAERDTRVRGALQNGAIATMTKTISVLLSSIALQVSVSAPGLHTVGMTLIWAAVAATPILSFMLAVLMLLGCSPSWVRAQAVALLVQPCFGFYAHLVCCTGPLHSTSLAISGEKDSSSCDESDSERRMLAAHVLGWPYPFLEVCHRRWLRAQASRVQVQ